MADFEKAFEKTVAKEGGYSNDPVDLGGETRFGISKRAYPDLDIRNLTMADAKAIYRRDFWNLIKGDALSGQAVAEAIFDIAVNLGVSKACVIAQNAAGIFPQDGILGATSIAAINKIPSETFLAFFALRVIARYVDICTRLPDQKRFLLGWVRRALGVWSG